MAVNLELKARTASNAGARERALALGASPSGTLHQVDTYFVVPRGRLKLREFSGGEAELIYYERSEETPERWSRYTRERVGEPGAVCRVLAAAFGVQAVVRKRRDLYLWRDARIHVDDVEGLGTFLEFEVTGGETPATVATMQELRAAFAVAPEDVVKCSYSDMIPAKRISPDA